MWFLSVAFATLVPVGSFALPIGASVPAVAFLGGAHREAPRLSMVAAPVFLLVLAVGSVITDPGQGLWSLATLLTRWGAVIYGALFFSFATEAQEVHFLTRWTRLPNEIGIALCFAARTVPTTVEQLSGLVSALQLRGLLPFSLSLQGLRKVLPVLPDLILALLVSSVRRTEQMWVALEARGGWEGSPTFFFSRDLFASLLLLSHASTMAVIAGLNLTAGIWTNGRWLGW